MKAAVIVCAIFAAGIASLVAQDSKTAYVLPDGAAVVVGNIATTFTCEGKKYGYYADIANECKVFHVCVPNLDADGKPNGPEVQFSFFCGNTTVFDQTSLLCKTPDTAIACDQSEAFFNVNDKFGIEEPSFNKTQ